jgi:hypothetical protein
MITKVEFNGDPTDYDIADLPEEAVTNFADFSSDFFDWLYDKNNEHDYWWLDSKGRKDAVCYRSEAFIEWLNKVHYKKEVAKKIDENNFTEDISKLPVIWF